MRLRFALVPLWICLIGTAAAQIYKWVDERGVTHYGEHPPQGQTARPVDTTPSTGPGTSRAKPQSSQDWQDRNIEFQKRRIQRERQAESDQKAAKAKQQRCILAKDELRQMESAGRLYDLNEKGERVYLDDTARRAAIENARQFVASNCP
jgi:hypothetical protein